MVTSSGNETNGGQRIKTHVKSRGLDLNQSQFQNPFLQNVGLTNSAPATYMCATSISANGQN